MKGIWRIAPGVFRFLTGHGDPPSRTGQVENGERFEIELVAELPADTR